eukprot:jgi/Hompol1/6991/HPOL_002398-RA
MFHSTTPKTCDNFLALCKGDRTSAVSGVPLSYKGCGFHRVISGFMLQGGDFTNHNGTGGESIYGEKFEDEDFSIKHDKAGLLSMANAGPNTNGSQFFITTVPTPHLNGKHVVFGRVIKGMDIVRTIENEPKGEQDRPVRPVTIADCGVLAEGEDDGVPPPADGDVLPEFPDDSDVIPEDHPQEFLEHCAKIKALGNTLLKQALAAPAGSQESVNLFMAAIKKYQKAVRYLEAINPSPEDIEELDHAFKIEFFALKVSCLSNQSLAFSKLEQWESELSTSQRILSIAETLAAYTARKPTAPLTVSPADQSKAYFRVGQAFVKQKQFKDGLDALAKAQSISPQDTMITKLISDTNKTIKDIEIREKKMYQKISIENPKPSCLLTTAAYARHSLAAISIKRPRCFLDVQIGDSGEIGRIVCEMFVDKTPKTCENFMELCKGERVSEFTGRELKYKGCKFHKVKKGFMLASGDFVNGTGFSGESIYGPKFDDESFELKHDRSGLLSMSNMGPNSNSSVFHIMTAKAHFLNKTNVVFGRVIN